MYMWFLKETAEGQKQRQEGKCGKTYGVPSVYLLGNNNHSLNTHFVPGMDLGSLTCISSNLTSSDKGKNTDAISWART